MKKILTFALILMLVCLFLDKTGMGDLHWTWDGDAADGPLGWLLGLLFAGGGLLIAAVVIGVVLAGVGLVLASVIGLLVLLALVFSSPLLLPLIALALVWLLVSRNRRQPQP